MLTDQVAAQGAKIRDLQSSLVEHQYKLDSTEEMLQQVQSFKDLKSKHLIGFWTIPNAFQWTKIRTFRFTRKYPGV